MVSNIDENFGRLRETLQELGIEDDTILVFMTDNGSAGGVTVDEEGFVTTGFSNGFRGCKNWEYDGGHRVPFFMRYPNYINKTLSGGKDFDTLCANIDFMPTILDLAEADVPADRSFHGTSLTPLLDNTGDPASPQWRGRALVTDSQRVAYPIKWRKSSVMKNRWRLINGRELYDIESDREQRNDISTSNEALVQELRQDYDTWWDICAAQYERICAIDIGGSDPVTTLTAHDIRNETCDAAWLQSHVRQVKQVRGFWDVDVKESGDYAIELRRWPRGTSHAICAGIEGDDVEWRKDVIHERHEEYTGGIPVKVTTAALKIADIEASEPINGDDTEVTFHLKLPAGRTRLQAWFMGEPGADVFSPYYIYIERAAIV